MAIQTINLGAAANDGNGDTIRGGGDKINDNFTEVYASLDTKVEEAPNDGRFYTRQDSAWEELVNTGDVSSSANVSPASKIAIFDGSTGKLIQDSDYGESDLNNWEAFYQTPSTVITAGNNLTWVGNTLNVTDIEVANIYVLTESEFIDAVENINLNYVGGNIFIGANILMTEDWLINLTNIDIYGFNHAIYTGTTDLGVGGFTITISSGSPTFYNITFVGSLNSLTTISMSSQDSRALFVIGSTSSSRAIAFVKCTFSDIIGGTGTVDVISSGAISTGRSLKITFNECLVTSHNAGSAFSMNGFTIGNSTTGGYLYVNAYGQQQSALGLGLNNTDAEYDITSSASSRTMFGSDGSARPSATSTLTAAKYISFKGIPTSATGLSTGDVWNNSGILTIVL